MKFIEPASPSPEEEYIKREELLEFTEETFKKTNLLIKLAFRRQEIFDAWYAHTIQSATITAIAAAQQISWTAAKKRINTANKIVLSFQHTLHKIDD